MLNAAPIANPSPSATNDIIIPISEYNPNLNSCNGIPLKKYVNVMNIMLNRI